MVTTLERPVSTERFENVLACRTREEWLQARRSLIGASDSAAIFGVGYADHSPVTVWDSKVNERPVDAAEPKRFKIGRLMEPALRAIFAEETGLECISGREYGPPDCYDVIHVHPTIPWLGATLDGTCLHDEYGTCPVELKNVSNFNRDEWEGDEPPLKFAVQCQHQMVVTGASHAFLLGLIGGNEPVIKVIERNPRFCDAMLAKLEEFWGYVERREIPPVDASIATARLLSKLWPEDNGETVVLPEEALAWSGELESAKDTIKKAEAVKTAAENKIKAAIGSATFGEIPGGFRYSWKTQTRKEHVVAESTFRVLRKCG